MGLSPKRESLLSLLMSAVLVSQLHISRVVRSSEVYAVEQRRTLPGSSLARGCFLKHLFSERLCRIEFYMMREC